MPAEWNATIGSLQLPVIMTSVPFIMAMEIYPKRELHCLRATRPQTDASFLLFMFTLRIQVFCNVMLCHWIRVSRCFEGNIVYLAFKICLFSWIHLFLYFVTGCIKQFRSSRCAKSDNVVRSGSDMFRKTREAMNE